VVTTSLLSSPKFRPSRSVHLPSGAAGLSHAFTPTELAEQPTHEPALTELMADARRASFDVLLIWRFDRLSRSVTYFVQVVEELRRLGIELLSHEQSFDTTTPIGKFTLTMFWRFGGTGA
jgi:hypothetical protein